MASLTKEELRNALVAHGVTDLPPLSAKKEELKALYEEHVAPIANDSAEFSSDDEVSLKSASKRASTVSRASKVSSASKLSKVSKSSSKSPKKAAEDTLVVDDLDIDALDDDELFEKLRENGVDVGPIVASTRPFYKKKLALVLKGETMNSTNGNGAEYSDTDPETEEEAEEEQPAVEARVTRSSASSKKASRSSQSPKESPMKSPTPIGSVLSGLRQRTARDEADAGKLTPTPRRSIHSYSVTETTKQVITRSRDGTETRDVTTSIQRSENGKVVEDSNKKSWSKTMVTLIKVLLLVAILGAIYLAVLSKDDGTLTVDQIDQAIKEAEAQEAVPPVREEVVQGNIGDV